MSSSYVNPSTLLWILCLCEVHINTIINYSNLNIHKRIKSVIVVQRFAQKTVSFSWLTLRRKYVGLRSVEMVKTEELDRNWNKAAVA